MRALGRARALGFTLVELIVVLALVAIVASVGFSRVSDDSSIKARRFGTDVAALLGSAQRLAMAQRRTIHVLIDTGTRTLSVCLDIACAQPISAAPDQPGQLAAPTGLGFSSTVSALSFDSRGIGQHTSALNLRVNDSDGTYLGHRVVLPAGSADVQLLHG